MTEKETFGIIAVIIGFSGYVPYLRDIFKRRAHPHPYTWAIWAATATIGFGIMLAGGAGAGAWSTGLAVVMCTIVAASALKQDGAKHITRMDTFTLLVAMVALGLWLLADEPLLAITLLTLTDLVGILPTVRKTWKRPYSETTAVWALSGLRYVFVLLALQTYTAVTMMYGITWLIGNALFVGMMLYRRRRVRRPKLAAG